VSACATRANNFKVQEEIAQAIAHSLAGVLGERQVTVAASTQNLDAYQNFLRGRARFQQRSELLAAIADLTQATEQDPNFGQAWIYLAAAWLTAPGYYSEADLGVANAMVQAGGALQKAEALLPQHPMLLATQGNLLDRSGDLAGGLALLQKSAKLSTQDSTPTLWFGLLLLRAGYVAEATTTLEKAQAMDPLAGVNTGYLALARLSSGAYAEAELLARQARAQGWDAAMFLVIYDLAGRDQHERAVALWDELLASRATQINAERAALIRQALQEPQTDVSALASGAFSRDGVMELGVATQRFDSQLTTALQRFAEFQNDIRTVFWLRSAWIPSTLGLREDPRFFTFSDQLGMVRLWEARGYPDGCKRVQTAGSDHLDCGGAP
jgi:adenylate cyclase